MRKPAQSVSMDQVYGMPGHLIRRAQQIAVSIFLEECASLDLTPVQYAALVAIDDNPDIDATRLSALVAFDRSTLSNVLERLETKGLIARVNGKADKRVKVLHLTPEGKSMLEAAHPMVLRVQQRILEPIAVADRDVFLRTLSHLVDHHNESSRAPLKVARAGR